MAGQLAGKAILITGGASGIGKAAATACAREGARVVVADLSEPAGREVAEKLAANGAEAHFVRADVTRTADVKALVERALALLGRLDCAFNNAGLIGAGGLSAYIASKHAVIGLTKTAALENAKQHVRVNAVCPGVIQTPMLDRLAESAAGFVEGVSAVTPMGRVGTPEEIAEAVVWLFSDASSFVTGHALTVDGGYVVP